MAAVVAALAAGALGVSSANAATDPDVHKGMLFFNGGVVRTVVVPVSLAAGSGTDPFYAVTNGAAGQLGIAGVAPGSPDYHGGHWAVSTVTFSVTPYLLKSTADVQAAALAGDVSVTRVGSKDFLCPVQP